MTDVPLRAGDADRDAVIDRLRDALAEGRLTHEEFSERVDRATQARTLPELVALTADLPSSALLPSPVPLRDLVAPGRRAALRPVAGELATWAAAFALCNLIWVLTGAAGPWWPGWLLIGLVVIARRAVR